MSLRLRFSLLLAGLFFSLSLVTWLAFDRMLSEINMQWGKQFATRQVLFNKYRTLDPLIREIRLARQMADEPALLEFAQDENNPALRNKAMETLEHYRMLFRDHSYFAAFKPSGHYYFNDANNGYAGKQLRYTLSPTNQNDGWFYATMAYDKDYQVNLDPDTHLGVVKVWINVLLRRGDRVLGVIGTGIDLTDFLKHSVGLEQPGIHNLFVDKSLAIQLAPDRKLIDYSSLTKDVSERQRINMLFSPQDARRIEREVALIGEREDEVRTLWVTFKDERHLLGLTYLPEVGWYDITLMDERSMMLLDRVIWLPLLYFGLLLVALAILALLFQRWVLGPIQQLKESAEAVHGGNYAVPLPPATSDEIGGLTRTFGKMLTFVQDNHSEQERVIRERTVELQHMIELDPLTGLLNRRGIADRFEREIARHARNHSEIGILMLDLDNFKSINDSYGHAAGDLALCAASDILRTLKRPYDYAGRWGGEEFLIILPECTREDLLTVAERIRVDIAKLMIEAGDTRFSFTVSIGAHHSRHLQTMDAMLTQVDQALYTAKDDGRNCVRLSQNDDGDSPLPGHWPFSLPE